MREEGERREKGRRTINKDAEKRKDEREKEKEKDGK